MKEACDLLKDIARRYPLAFEGHAHRYVQEDCLFKAVCNGKKVIVDLAHECIKEIVANTCNPK